jgi:hypothetical protein
MDSRPLYKRKRQDEIASNSPTDSPSSRRENENTHRTDVDEHALPSPGGAPNDGLAALAETAKNYARAARANNTVGLSRMVRLGQIPGFLAHHYETGGA